MKVVKEPAPIICEGCGEVFIGKYAYFCPNCRKEQNSQRAKLKRGDSGRFEKVKIPPLQHFELPPPELKGFNPMEMQNTIEIQINAVVADLQDQALIKAIIKYSIEQGFDDLYVIDEEFVKSAIINEIKRRKGVEE